MLVKAEDWSQKKLGGMVSHVHFLTQHFTVCEEYQHSYFSGS